MTAIVKTSANISLPSTFPDVETCAEVLTNVMHMEDVEKLLDRFAEEEELIKAADNYADLRRRYAALEAAACKRIYVKGWGAALGAANSLRKKAARWLALDDAKYKERIESILHGDHTLISLYKDSCCASRISRHTYVELGCKREIIRDYKRDGWARLEFSDESYYMDRFESSIGEDFQKSDKLYRGDLGPLRGMRSYIKACEDEITNAIAASTRIKLRNMGAVGVGGGRYIDPKRHPDEVDEAFTLRRKNVAYCILRLYRMCKEIDGYDFAEQLNRAFEITKISGLKYIKDQNDDSHAR